MSKSLIIEIGTEELPSSYMKELEKQLNRSFRLFLEENYLSFADATVFMTPRRMVFFVNELATCQTIPEKIIKGPPHKMALTEKGEPTEALKGFLIKCQTEDYQVDGNYIYAKMQSPNLETGFFLEREFPNFILRFPFEKKMRWEIWQFIRPIRWIVAFFGDQIIDLSICGIHSSAVSRGLRGFDDIPIVSAEDYFGKMKQNNIELSSAKRKERIENKLKELHQIPKEDIVWENVNRTESPVISEASFSEDLLALPPEVISTVISNQLKCFPAWQEDILLPKFYFFMNGERKLDLVRKGYEKVITARLNDAKYFYERDQKVPLSERTSDLAKITFIEKLGTLADKTNRMVLLSANDSFFSGQKNLLTLILLSKADLSTTMVQELTELQGTMGKTYALMQEVEKEVAYAIEDHYHPRSEEDTLPESSLATSLSILDRVDTITGIHAIGMTVSSSSDPLGLRRIANGFIRILLHHFYPLEISKLFEDSLETYRKVNLLNFDSSLVKKNLAVFYLTRLRNLLSTSFRYDVIEAIVPETFANPYLLQIKGKVISEQINTSDFKILCDSYTRIKNITKEKDQEIPVEELSLEKQEEKDLYQVWEQVKNSSPIISQENVKQVLVSFYQFNQPIAAFFEKILVMDENLVVRKHRLQLLFLIFKKLNQFADFSKIVFEGGEK